MLTLQESITTTTTLNEELQIDVNDLHEARREDAKNHNNIMEKFKRRETNLEQVRHDALVECKFSFSFSMICFFVLYHQNIYITCQSHIYQNFFMCTQFVFFAFPFFFSY